MYNMTNELILGRVYDDGKLHCAVHLVGSACSTICLSDTSRKPSYLPQSPILTSDIDKTYNATPRRSDLPRSPHGKALINQHEAFDLTPLTPAALSPSASPPQIQSIIISTQDTTSATSQPNRDLIVFHNFDACRSADLSLVVIIFYTLSTLVFSRGVSWGPTFIVAQAIIWRLLHSVG